MFIQFVFSGDLNNSMMPCDRIWLINLSYCNTSARGNDEMCLSLCEIILQGTVNFRVPLSTDKQSVNEQIPENKTTQYHT